MISLFYKLLSVLIISKLFAHQIISHQFQFQQSNYTTNSSNILTYIHQKKRHITNIFQPEQKEEEEKRNNFILSFSKINHRANVRQTWK